MIIKTTIFTALVLLVGCESPTDSMNRQAAKHTKEQARSPKKALSVSQFPRMKPDASFRSYEAIHKSARSVLPWAVEIEKKYGDVDHFITHFGFRKEKTNLWNTEVFFGDRYSLTLQVEVVIDYKNERITLAGKPEFLLLEFLTCDVDGSSKIGRNFRFDESQFNKLVKSEWEYSEIGFDATGKSVPNFDLTTAMTRAPRYPISLLK